MDNILGIVIKRYGPKATAMDVCNEILDDNGKPDNLPFKRILGDNWYEEAFQMAKKYRDQYAPQMLLFSKS
jgi:GH35 family endo-1,4-beta-xylanase